MHGTLVQQELAHHQPEHVISGCARVRTNAVGSSSMAVPKEIVLIRIAVNVRMFGCKAQIAQLTGVFNPQYERQTFSDISESTQR